MRPCEFCGQLFEPARSDHRFHSGACRRAADKLVPYLDEPPSQEVQAAVERLFDPRRDGAELVCPDDWHPAEEWRALDAQDTVRQRRRWYLAQLAE